jgi:hypothetical protein
MTPNEIAKREADYLRSLPATVIVDGATITLAHDRGTFKVECLSEDRFMIGPSGVKNGFQARVTEPRVEANRKVLFERARTWAKSDGLDDD